MAETAATLDVARTISGRLTAVWEAYKSKDEAAHNALLTDDYLAVHPDGTRHEGKPSARDIAAASIAAYNLADLRVVRVDIRTALVRYTAEVHLSGGDPVRFLVGEVWVERGGQWLCRYFQGTLTK